MPKITVDEFLEKNGFRNLYGSFRRKVIDGTPGFVIMTPLSLAILCNLDELAKEMISLGAPASSPSDIQIKGNFSTFKLWLSPLGVAAYCNKGEILQLLLASNPSCLQNPINNNAIKIAALMRHTEIVAALTAAGAKEASALRPSETQLSDVYHHVYERMSHDLYKSMNRGKKRIFIMGEQHGDLNGFLYKLIILSIARNLGIVCLAVEETSSSLQEKNERYSNAEITHQMLCEEMMGAYVSQAESKGMHIEPVDSYSDFLTRKHNGDQDKAHSEATTEEGLQERSREMSENISKLFEHAVFETGTFHLKHYFYNFPIEPRHYDVTFFNLSPPIQDVYCEFEMSLLEKVFSTPKISHLYIEGNFLGMQFGDLFRTVDQVSEDYRRLRPALNLRTNAAIANAHITTQFGEFRRRKLKERNEAEIGPEVPKSTEINGLRSGI